MQNNFYIPIFSICIQDYTSDVKDLYKQLHCLLNSRWNLLGLSLLSRCFHVTVCVLAAACASSQLYYFKVPNLLPTMQNNL